MTKSELIARLSTFSPASASSTHRLACRIWSDAAVKLTTGAFGEMAAHPDIGRSEALRRSMLALMNDEDKPHFAHPMFWAPFVVVGEGGIYQPN